MPPRWKLILFFFVKKKLFRSPHSEGGRKFSLRDEYFALKWNVFNLVGWEGERPLMKSAPPTDASCWINEMEKNSLRWHFTFFLFGPAAPHLWWGAKTFCVLLWLCFDFLFDWISPRSSAKRLCSINGDVCFSFDGIHCNIHIFLGFLYRLRRLIPTEFSTFFQKRFISI